MNEFKDPLTVMSGLKPAPLDSLADDGYRRKRHDDLAMMAAEGRSRAVRPRRAASRRRLAKPRLVLAVGGLAVAATAGAAVATAFPGEHSSPAQHNTTARSFLLTSATVAARSPAATGAYWYTKQRDYQSAAAKAESRGKEVFHGATSAATEESWSGQARARTIVNENVTVTFATAADKARWVAAGKPRLVTPAGLSSTAPVTTNDPIALHWGVGSGRFDFAGMQKLPVTAAALDKVLTRLWNREPDKAGAVGLPHPTFTQYLVAWADQLLTGPAQPGTRAAIYQLLAGQQGIDLVKGVTDPLGRTGVAIGDGGGDFLVIDPGTVRLLAYVSHPVTARSTIRGQVVEVYVATGWTDQLGARP